MVRVLLRAMPMSMYVQKRLTRADADPALSIEGLDEFFPEDHQEDDLAVPSDQELFRARAAPAAITAAAPSTALDSALASELDDYFRGLHESDTAFEEPAFQSKIQCAVMEFQRFAEKFHAFAAECQQR